MSAQVSQEMVERFRVGALGTLYAAWTELAALHVLVGFLVCFALLSLEGTFSALGWFAVLACFHAFHVIRIHSLDPTKHFSLVRLTQTVRVFAFAVGLVWGALALLTFKEANVNTKILVTGAILLIAAPTAVLNVVDRLSVVAFLVPTLGVLAIALIRHRGGLFLVFAPLLISAMAIIVVMARSRYRELSSRNHMAVEKAWLAEQLRQKNNLLEQNDRSKTRCLAVVSHDLRQPVHALGMLMELLLNTPASLACRDQLESMALVLRSLSHSLESLLDISKLDAGATAPKLRAIDGREFLEQIYAEFQLPAQQKGLSLVLTCKDIKVRTDAPLLHSIVCNLVGNAVRYTTSGTVAIAADIVAEDSRWVRLTVTDTGPGIAPEDLEKIFEDYARLEQDPDNVRGLGLGLSIVKKAAQLLGHRVAVQSTVGKGSTFSVYLEAAALDDPVDSPLTRPNPFALLGSCGVIIDNDKYVLHSMHALLTSCGCQLITARDCDDLERKLQRAQIHIDFVVADYHLGTKRTGMDAIKLVREHQLRNVPSLILTGDIEIRVADQRSFSNLEVMHKPVPPDKLRCALELSLLRYRDMVVL